MTTTEIINALHMYAKTAHPDDADMLKNVENHIKNHPKSFERYKEDGACHIAASVLLLTPDLQKALFLRHAKIQKWTQLGGHADGNRNLAEVALRELLEETGVRATTVLQKNGKDMILDIRTFDYSANVYGYKKSIYNFCYVVLLPDGQNPKIMEPDKCEKMMWFTVKQARDMIAAEYHEGTAELIDKWERLQNSLL